MIEQHHIARHNTRCCVCHHTIPAGLPLVVMIFDGNPVGTGPARHPGCALR